MSTQKGAAEPAKVSMSSLGPVGGASAQEPPAVAVPAKNDEASMEGSGATISAQQLPPLKSAEGVLMQRSPAVTVFSKSDTLSPKPIESVSTQQLSALVPGFDGTTNVIRWTSQVKLLKEVYSVDDGLLKIIVIGKLSGRPLEWFYSDPENLMLSLDELFTNLTEIFRSKTDVVHLRRQLESRKWKFNETFSSYFQDKMVISNQLKLSDSETVDYLIDGLDDHSLENQARMQKFFNPKAMLSAMIDVVKSRPKFNLQKDSKHQKSEQKSGLHTPKCYNCGNLGHIAPRCPNPRRDRDSCYTCGERGHKQKDCNVKRSSGATERRDVLNVEHCSRGYIVDIHFENGLSLKALIDSGSPVSLIKKKFVLNFNKLEFTLAENLVGINNAKLEVLGILSDEFVCNDFNFSLQFRVVPDDMMRFDVLLGRDFIGYDGISLTFAGDKVLMKKVIEDRTVEEETGNILNIEYISSIENDQLDIGKVDHEVEREFKSIFEHCYLKAVKPLKPGIEYEMKIKLKEDKPFYFTPRRMSFSEKSIVKEIIDDLLKRKIIQPSCSPYASRIVLVKKRTGETRLCVDFRELNKITVKDRFPLPLIEDCLDKLRDKRVFSLLDLKNGFHQIRIAEESVPLTAFVTHDGQYEYLRVPFGLCNAPAAFQRFILSIFNHLVERDVVVIYVDDILVATKTVDEHLSVLREVFCTLSANLLELKLSKCKFLKPNVEYLGYQVNGEGISPSADHISHIKNFPMPRNTVEVHRFVGLVSYFRKFIKDFATIAKPLYELLKKNVTFTFGFDQLKSFENLKQKLIGPSVLRIYCPQAETELHCDASSVGLGAILLQRQSDDNRFHPVMFYSKRTTEAESKYHSFELETLAIVQAIKRFRIYLAGITFTIVTDCEAFVKTMNKKDINPRISRWALFLQDFSYKIIHRSGNRMRHVDALSRSVNIVEFSDNSIELALAVAQNKDPKILELRGRLENGNVTDYELRDGLVYRRCKSGLLFYVPEKMVNSVVRLYHDDVGHVGLDKSCDLIKRSYWFPSMKQRVSDYIMNCLKCIVYSGGDGKKKAFLHSISKGDRPFHTLHVDHVGPLELTKRKNRHILVVIDAFTKFTKLYATKTTNAKEAIEALSKYFSYYSKPVRVISDRGSAFTSSAFRDYLKDENISQVLIAASCPRANGQVERMNRFFIPIICKMMDKEQGLEWDLTLGKAEYAINNTKSRSTNEMPSKLLFGICQRSKDEDPLREYFENADEFHVSIDELRECASRKIQSVQLKNENYYNESCRSTVKYKEGDYIMIRNIPAPGESKKLQPRFKGPYVIKKCLPNDRYLVGDIEGFQISRVPFEGIFDPGNMKSYIGVLNKVENTNDSELLEVGEENSPEVCVIHICECGMCSL